jgi:hypothetical protein
MWVSAKVRISLPRLKVGPNPYEFGSRQVVGEKSSMGWDEPQYQDMIRRFIIAADLHAQTPCDARPESLHISK